MSTPTLPGRIQTSIERRVAVITIDHPSRHNALTGEMLDELTTTLARLSVDPAVSVVMVTGSGPHFCAGMDIRELRSARESGIRMEDRVTDAEEALAAFPKPTVAAIAGYCIGGGAQLALACDIRIAAENAEFAVTPAKLGVIYPARTITRLVRTLGPATAKRLVITGDRVGADTALTAGIFAEVVPVDRLRTRAAALADTIASRSSITQQAAKEMIDAAAGRGIDGKLEHRWAVASNPDLQIGLDAFLAGNAPKFSNP
ncbi:enoyl-CoA hydratase/isomerase family protein [Rhodococcus globerulus]|uniref:enoyl-CoA hydratase/isomerase family protein n=1 Tax=Rhodococcus globerulus TaxID=33008 RepID=UPI000525DB61|nr:enoyl-CoA hydratase/isomerase family protein [Rhodococcus globerulus]PVX59621.1 enoyl-CoA hydratase/carnithine racemase [Rhodococcus globerulus]